MKKRLKIPYFPLGLKYASALLIAAGVYMAIIGFILWAVLLFFLSAIILTTHYITEIDVKEKRYRDYLSLLGIALNEDAKNFTTLGKIVVSKGSYAQTVNTRVQSRQFDWSDYTATLLMDDGQQSIDLLTRNEKSALLSGVKEFALSLQLNVEDRTTGSNYYIDMSKA